MTVIGAGYVGLVTAACLAELGHRVTCIESDELRLSPLIAGSAAFYEPGLQALLVRHAANGRLDFAATPAACVPQSRFTIVAVQTPALEDGGTDVSFVLAAVAEIAPFLGRGAIVILKSTVPPGTAERTEALLGRLGADAAVVSNPEFLRQGSAVHDFLHPDRIAIGADSAEAAEATALLYSRVNAPIMTTSRGGAEMGKYVSNALLAVRISFMNEIAGICDGYGIDPREVVEIVGADQRLGAGYLQAGLGWGGSCLGKDLASLMAMGERVGVRTATVSAAAEVNQRQRERAVALLRDSATRQGHADPTVGIFGLTFKPGTDDLRDAPAIAIMRRLADEGVGLRAHDPVALGAARREFSRAVYHDSPYETATGCDALLLATEWDEYVNLDWGRIKRSMRGGTVLDGRNALDPRLLRGLGFRYIAFGAG